ncbi:hypothetical protein JHK85_043866 [Glycine max]|nr:hypothetical protein JHK85_043866 [Glycine max]
MNMMYWDAFIGLKVPKDSMLPRPKVLVGFAEAEAEVRAITPKCYEDNLKAKRGLYEPTKQYGVHFMELDP